MWRDSSDIRNNGEPSQSLATPTSVVSGAPAAPSIVASAPTRARRSNRLASLAALGDGAADRSRVVIAGASWLCAPSGWGVDAL